MSSNENKNRLLNENSRYLQAHKDDLVAWWPYGPEALARATEEDKPLFISSGSFTSLGCIMMQEDQFQNPAVAKLLNDNFINIKLDRDEYPDLDRYFQEAAHFYRHPGGWPLSIFTFPNLRPFFIGGFFPDEATKNTPSFKQVIEELVGAYKNQRDTLKTNADTVFGKVSEGLIPKDKVEFQGHFPPPMAIMEAIKQMKDIGNGGFGHQEGSPRVTYLPFYEWACEQMLEGMLSREEGKFVLESLEKMFMGAVHDHARGGIHPFAIDRKWMHPKFEKNLFDQASALKVMAKASLLYPSPLFFDGLINTLDYLEREMLSDENFFFSSQKGETEGVEGLYFTFTEEEFDELVKGADTEEEKISEKLPTIKKWFMITKDGNLKSRLNTIKLDVSLRDEFQTKENWDIIRKVRQAIVDERGKRIPPATDTKGVASWNFQMLTALCDVFQYCKIGVIRQKAFALLTRTLDGIFKTFVVAGGENQPGMMIRHTTTRGAGMPYFEDYLYFAEAMMRIYEITGNETFKMNTGESLRLLVSEFVGKDGFYTRPVKANEAEFYPNQVQNAFDTYVRSPAASALSLIRRAKVLFGQDEWREMIRPIKETLINEGLKNPVGCGELLRSATYPSEVYRTVSVPRLWLQDESFIDFLSYFLPRFVFNYHNEKEGWQIGTKEKGELKGITLKDFFAALTPPQADKNQ